MILGNSAMQAILSRPQATWTSRAAWQRCPICEGHGMIASGLPNTMMGARDRTCPTCNGKRIISTTTGRPPAEASRARADRR